MNLSLAKVYAGGGGGEGNRFGKLVPGAVDLLDVGSSYSPAFSAFEGNQKGSEDSQGSGESSEGHLFWQVDLHCGLVIKTLRIYRVAKILHLSTLIFSICKMGHLVLPISG